MSKEMRPDYNCNHGESQKIHPQRRSNVSLTAFARKIMASIDKGKTCWDRTSFRANASCLLIFKYLPLDFANLSTRCTPHLDFEPDCVIWFDSGALGNVTEAHRLLNVLVTLFFCPRKSSGLRRMTYRAD